MNQLPREAEILAAKLGELRGISADEAVVFALQETLARSRAERASDAKPTDDAMMRRIKEISARYRARPLLDDRSADEILGYDEFGVPR